MEPVTVICGRLAEHPYPTVRSERAHCAGCDQLVWVTTDALERAVADGRTRFVCGFCFASEARGRRRA